MKKAIEPDPNDPYEGKTRAEWLREMQRLDREEAQAQKEELAR